MQQLGGSEVWGHASQKNCLFGPKWCFSEARQQSFTCMSIYFSAYCAVQHWFWLFDRLLISQVTPESQMSLVRLTESCWEEDSEEILSHGLQPSQHVSSQRALCDVLCRNWSGIHWSNWWHQAKPRGKKWSSWNWWLAATVLQLVTEACY